MTLRILAFFIMALALTSAMSCQAKQPNDPQKGLDMPVATIDGETITLADVVNHPGIQDIVGQIILEKLVLKKAAEQKFEITDDNVYEAMQPYVEKQGGRRKFLDEQHQKGLTLKKTIYFGKVGLLQEKIVDSLLTEPTYDEVVAFLQTDTGRLAYKLKAQELGKKPEDITVEEVYDMALDRVRETKRRDLYDKLEKEILPAGHEVVNLMKAAVMDDAEGDTWAALEPAPPEEGYEPSGEVTPEQIINGGSEGLPSEGNVKKGE